MEPTQSFDGQVIAITGAASGIGLAAAKHFFSLGAIVSIADITSESLAKAAVAIHTTKPGRDPLTILTTVIDVSSSDAVDKWIKATVDTFGRLDGAVNSASIRSAQMGQSYTHNVTDQEWEKCLTVNSTGLFCCLRAELRAMNNGSSIVNLASIAGVVAIPGGADYCASKHAVVGLTVTAAKEEGRNDIRVNAVAPGFIDTPMVQTAPEALVKSLKHTVGNLPISRLGNPYDVVGAIAFLLSKEILLCDGTNF